MIQQQIEVLTELHALIMGYEPIKAEPSVDTILATLNSLPSWVEDSWVATHGKSFVFEHSDGLCRITKDIDGWCAYAAIRAEITTN